MSSILSYKVPTHTHTHTYIYIYIYIDVENYIVPSKHFPNNGLMSAMLLGKEYGKVGI